MSYKTRRFGFITLIATLAVVMTIAVVAAQVSGLLANVPEPAGATYQAKDAIHQGGVHFYYTTSQSPADMVSGNQKSDFSVQAARSGPESIMFRAFMPVFAGQKSDFCGSRANTIALGQRLCRNGQRAGVSSKRL